MARTTTVRLLFLGLALGVAAGCSNRDIYRDWFSEAGASLDEGGFGDPTMNNILVQSGQKPVMLDLNRKFAESVPTTINFAFDSARLDAAARRTLLQQANFIKQFPELRFRVYGHTDLVGSEAYNKRLGLRRAQAVVNFFAAQGISRSRLEAMVSFGEEQPLVASQGPELRNRRTVTEVSGFVERHPTLLNGKYAEVIFREYVTSAEPGGGGAEAGAVPAPGGQ